MPEMSNFMYQRSIYALHCVLDFSFSKRNYPRESDKGQIDGSWPRLSIDPFVDS